MNSFLNSEIPSDTGNITFLKNSNCEPTDDENSAPKSELNGKTADGDTKITSYYSKHHSWRKKSFADIVKKTCDCIDTAKADSCGDIGNEGNNRVNFSNPGQLFDSIDNTSVRSVLENLFKEPCDSEHQFDDDFISFDYTRNANKTQSFGKTQSDMFNGNSTNIPVRSILKNIFHEDKSHSQDETNYGNMFNFRYNLSDLLYERPRSADSSLQPSTYFVCPRCGEITNLDTNDLEGLGSVGDRCLTNFRRFRKGQKSECARRYVACNQWTTDGPWGGRSRSNFSSNPFSGLNQKKRNRYKESKKE